jgi:hypothetical protein
MPLSERGGALSDMSPTVTGRSTAPTSDFADVRYAEGAVGIKRLMPERSAVALSVTDCEQRFSQIRQFRAARPHAGNGLRTYNCDAAKR